MYTATLNVSTVIPIEFKRAYSSKFFTNNQEMILRIGTKFWKWFSSKQKDPLHSEHATLMVLLIGIDGPRSIVGTCSNDSFLCQ